jgi:CHAT domain-containing protein/Flp pilus assembly protein TadD
MIVLTPQLLLAAFSPVVAQTTKDQKAEADRLLQQGLQQFQRNEYQAAMRSWEQALSLYRAVQDRNGEAAALGNLGVAYLSLSQYPKAIAYYEQALPLFRAVQDRDGEASALMNLGTAHLSLSQYPKAIAYYEQALPLFRAVQDRNGEAGALNNLGIAYLSLSQYPEAIAYYEQALPLFRAVQDRDGEAKTLNNWGYALFASGQLAPAAPLLHQAIQLQECLRVGLKDDQKVSIFEAQLNSYRTLQQVLIAQNQPAEALEIAERGRARAFVELLAQRLGAPSTPQTQETVASGGAATPQPDSSCTPVPPLTLAQMQQIAQQQNATLVEYSVIGNQQLFIWVIPPTGDLTFRAVDLKPLLKAASLNDLVNAVRDKALGVRARTGGIGTLPQTGQTRDLAQVASLKTLHQVLIAPIADQLPTDPTQRVIFIPQGALFLVPFAALQADDGKYLVDRHTIVTAPSIQTLELTRKQKLADKRQQTGGRLIVGNPVMPKLVLTAGAEPIQLGALPGAELEAKALSQLFKQPVLIGAQATETTVKAQMPQARLIHLATHGIFDDQVGLNSGIALTATRTDDGLLTAAEILDLKLQADLVVLSACDTGRGEITGDGVIGLSRALISAGVPSVLVSLWSVPDAPTADLMVKFYQNLQQQPDKAQALRQAMLQVKESYPNVQDWAAFTLIGEAD